MSSCLNLLTLNLPRKINVRLKKVKNSKKSAILDDVIGPSGAICISNP